MREISKNMRLTGMLLFRDSLIEAMSTRQSILCVIHMAQAAEILLKARIADEHPLLIFSKIPERKESTDDLSLEVLLERGQTISYLELPDRLWAATGITIKDLEGYRKFGRLRNQLIHVSMTTRSDLNKEALRYGLKILDPLVNAFWEKSVTDFIIEHPWDGEHLRHDIQHRIVHDEDEVLMQKLEEFPKLRVLIREDIDGDWQFFRNKIEEERKIFRESFFKYSEIYSSSKEEQEMAEILSQDQKEKEARWQSLLDDFTSN